MIAVISQWIVIGAGAWLAALGLFMFAAPQRALDALSAMGGSKTIHFGEMALRLLIGVAMVLALSVSRFPQIIGLVGWFLIASAVVIAALPRRWHAGYSTWWAQRIPPAAVRAIAPLSVIRGGLLIWAMLPPTA